VKHLLNGRLTPYLVTFLTVAIASALKVRLQSSGYDSTFMLYYSCVMISAWFGGLGQGLLATILCLTASDYFIYGPGGLFDLTPQQAVRATLFFFDGVLVSILCSALRSSKQRAEEALGIAKAARSASQINEIRFRRVAESNLIGLMELKRDGTILDCNDYFADLVGVSRADIQAGRLSWQSITPAELRAASQKAVDQIYESGVLPPFEKEYIRRDGSRVPVLLGAAKICEDRHVTYLVDLTESKKGEWALAHSNIELEERVAERTHALLQTTEQLTQSQKFLDSVIENLPVMISVKDAKDLRYVRLNKAGEKLLGRAREDMIGKSDFDLYPTSRARLSQKLERGILDHKAPHDSGEVPLPTRHGLRYLHERKVPIFDQEGRPSYLLSISEDVTEKKSAEQQRLTLLQEQAARAEAEKTAERLRFLSEASAALNESLQLRPMLDAFARVVVSHMADWCEVVLVAEGELKVDEVVIAHRDPNMIRWAENFVKEHAVDFEQRVGIGHVIRTGEPELHSMIDDTQIDANVRDEAKRRVYKKIQLNSAICVPLQCYGRVLGALSVCSTRTVSNRRYDQLDLSMLMDLAKRAAFAIENSRLFGKAQEASQAKSAFLANMSHEIRTPLGAMLGFAELMADDHLTSEQRRYIETLSRNGQQLLRIVDEVLDLSKVESNRLRIESVDFLLPGLIDDAASLLKQQAKEKGLLLNIVSSKNLPNKVSADPTRLRQILINVIGNAIKFTPDGHVDVNIEVHRRAAHPDRPILEISVTDTGIGITKEQREHLFQPFVQADNSMTRRFGGTGLGLFLSRKLARLMGGDVVLSTSHDAKGSKFIITLEIKTDEAGDLRKAEERSAAPSETERVLVVDDAPDNRTLIELYLTRLGYQSEVAEGGRQAVDMALRKKYGLILMDVQMPGMDGFEAVRELRAKNYNGPIVALTAHTMKGDRERCLEGGFDDYLGKPIDRELLRQSLGKFMPQSRDPRLGGVDHPSTSSVS
jgi:PAS domain S-box-containing protein